MTKKQREKELLKAQIAGKFLIDAVECGLSVIKSARLLLSQLENEQAQKGK